MSQIAELIPIALFFIAYQMDGSTVALAGLEYRFDGIYSATAVLMAATVLQLLLTRLITGHLEKRLLYMGAAVLVFGGATLALHDKLFIQWKPTIFNWAIAGVMVGTRLWTGRSAMQQAMGSQLELPEPAWRRLDLVWTVYFLVVGALNLVVAYGFSEATWVSYKFYSAIGFTILLSLLTVWLVMPYLSTEEEKPPADTP
ncbi:MAG: inner membrane-spanning protein YciB [Gammaproteobacteria bacterium]